MWNKLNGALGTQLGATRRSAPSPWAAAPGRLGGARAARVGGRAPGPMAPVCGRHGARAALDAQPLHAAVRGLHRPSRAAAAPHRRTVRPDVSALVPRVHGGAGTAVAPVRRSRKLGLPPPSGGLLWGGPPMMRWSPRAPQHLRTGAGAPLPPRRGPRGGRGGGGRSVRGPPTRAAAAEPLPEGARSHPRGARGAAAEARRGPPRRRGSWATAVGRLHAAGAVPRRCAAPTARRASRLRCMHACSLRVIR